MRSFSRPVTTTDAIEENLYRHRQELFGEVSIAFFDTTSLCFEGAGGETLGQLRERPIRQSKVQLQSVPESSLQLALRGGGFVAELLHSAPLLLGWRRGPVVAPLSANKTADRLAPRRACSAKRSTSAMSQPSRASPSRPSSRRNARRSCATCASCSPCSGWNSQGLNLLCISVPTKCSYSCNR